MFNGSENFNDDYFKATQKIGATEQNGTTSDDRTNYYQTVPVGALDSMLWLESDRMGHLLGAIDQAKLDEQRAVVKNEKRQRDNQPYAKADDLIMRATMPVGHPYDHSTIGSMADLDAASLDDVKEWFRTYYGPSNAVLTLSGDITPIEAKAKVEKYFGDIAPGEPVDHPQTWVVRNQGTVREVARDRVAQPRLYRVWNTSNYSSPDTDYLQMLAEVLAGDKNSRLYKRLVIDDKLATSVNAGVNNREIAGQFIITAMVNPGGDVGRVEKIVDEELKKLLETGPTAEEMSRVRTGILASFARSLESIAAKASTLAESQTFLGSPDSWQTSYERLKLASPADLQGVGKRWLSDGDYVLSILPFGDLAAATTPGADRSAMPMPQAVALAHFPKVERTSLTNGLKLIVARRPGVPVVNMTMLWESGTPKDFARIDAGTGALAMDLMDEGTSTRTGEQLVTALGALGATLSTGGGGETSTASLSALKPTLKPALAVYADVVLHPSFLKADLDRLKAQAVAGIQAAKHEPNAALRRVAPKLLFGSDNAYGRIVTEATVTAITREDVVAFHTRWVHPNNATLVIVGDTSLAEIRPLIEATFGAWKKQAIPDTIVPLSPGPSQSMVYLLDKPGTPQTVIRAALVAPPRSTGDDVARQAFNKALGGSFTSRLNMKLREEKGWAYGAGSGIAGGRGSQMFVASASVQSDKTAESMQEIAQILREVVSARPIAAQELSTAQAEMSLGLSSAWATSEGIAQYLIDQEVYRLPDDYYARYPANVTAISLDTVHTEVDRLMGKRPLTWLVAGDRAKIEGKIRALGLGDIRVIDADGNPGR
jgi:zinc protease